MHYNNAGSAEQEFRDAFDRLKRDQPRKLPKGTLVTQNNVAREAGRDPSALKKSRYPALIREIQQWIVEFARDSVPSPRQLAVQARRRTADLKDKARKIAMERDLALSKLVESDSLVLDLSREVERFRALLDSRNVTPIGRAEGQTSGSKVDP